MRIYPRIFLGLHEVAGYYTALRRGFRACGAAADLFTLSQHPFHYAAGAPHVGDIMYDVALRTSRLARQRSSILDRLGLAEDGFALATVHRAENTNDASSLARVMEYLRGVAFSLPVVLPLHPRTAAKCREFGIDLGQITTVEPVSYLDMLRLLITCNTVLTDSGGLQKEAYFQRRPCVTLRGETEWLETITCGWNRLWSDPEYAPRRDIVDYGDGTAASKIVDAIDTYFSKNPHSH